MLFYLDLFMTSYHFFLYVPTFFEYFLIIISQKHNKY